MKFFLLILALAIILNNAILFAYCRIMPRIESHIHKRRKKKETSEETISVDNSLGDKAEKNNAKSLKQVLVSTMLSFLNHYCYGWMRYCILCTGRIPSNRIRNIIYRLVFNAHISPKTVINGGCEIRSPWNFFAGNCVIMNNAILDARCKIIIKDNVVFGQGVHIWTEEHDVNSPTFAVTEDNMGPVIIEEHAWICSDSTILPDVHVGEGAVLGSRACATRDLDAFGIYVGIPAKKHGERNQNLTYVLSGKPHWHFY